MNPLSVQILIDLNEASKYFSGTKYQKILDSAQAQWDQGNIAAVRKTLKQLPSEGQLLSQLVEKLKGKSVHKTLERIKKIGESNLTYIKSISSILTHTIIECEKGNLEYRKLIPVLLNRLNKTSFELFKGE